MTVAASLAPRFAIVTIWPRSLAFIYRGLLVDYGVDEKCLSIRYGSEDAQLATLGDEDNFVERMRRGEADTLENLKAHCAAAVAEGAGAVLLGCTCMSPIAQLLAETVPVPVVDPMTVGYRYTELILSAGLNPLALDNEADAPTWAEVQSHLHSLGRE